MKLLRRFSVIALTLILVNGTIGSAWLFAPLYAAQIAGPLSLIAWLLAGAATILIALNYAELSTFLPIAGGSARFPQLSHGNFTNFIMSWFVWLSSVSAPPLEAQAALQYAATYFPHLEHTVNGIHQLTALGIFFSILLIGLLSLVNSRSYQILNRSNLIVFLFKIGVIVAAISLIIHTKFVGQHFANFGTQARALGFQPLLVAIASGGLIYALSGFKIITEMAGEAQNPSVSIPWAIIISIVISLLLYMGLQVAFIGAIDTASIQKGWQALSFPSDTGPLIGIAGILGLGALVKFLYADAFISPLGAGLVITTKAARLVYGMSKNGDFPRLFTRLNKHGFPHWAIFVNFCIGVLLLFPFPGWQQMMQFLASAAMIGYSMTPVALLCLRQQIPTKERPFKLWLAKFTAPLTFYICNLMFYWIGWSSVSKIAIASIIAFIYLTFRYAFGKINKERFGLRAIIWLGPHLLGLVVISYLGSFGGKHFIPFGWDFLIIAVFSAISLTLAFNTRLKHIDEQYLIYLKELTDSERQCFPKRNHLPLSPR